MFDNRKLVASQVASCGVWAVLFLLPVAAHSDGGWHVDTQSQVIARKMPQKPSELRGWRELQWALGQVDAVLEANSQAKFMTNGASEVTVSGRTWMRGRNTTGAVFSTTTADNLVVEIQLDADKKVMDYRVLKPERNAKTRQTVISFQPATGLLMGYSGFMETVTNTSGATAYGARIGYEAHYDPARDEVTDFKPGRLEMDIGDDLRLHLRLESMYGGVLTPAFRVASKTRAEQTSATTGNVQAILLPDSKMSMLRHPLLTRQKLQLKRTLGAKHFDAVQRLARKTINLSSQFGSTDSGKK